MIALALPPPISPGRRALRAAAVELDPPDPVARRQDDGALDDVAQLADIARPFIACSATIASARSRASARGVRRRNARRNARPARDVLAPLGQRRDRTGTTLSR
jgi:hypothetical protein